MTPKEHMRSHGSVHVRDGFLHLYKKGSISHCVIQANAFAYVVCNHPSWDTSRELLVLRKDLLRSCTSYKVGFIRVRAVIMLQY